MKPKYLTAILLITSLPFYLLGGPAFQTEIIDKNIKTLQVKVDDDAFSLPLINLNGNERINISFDEMSHESHSYSYEIIHCDADFSPSALTESEFLSGFSKGYIDDYERSINTTFLYTNYSFQIPNQNIKLKVSGNYLVNIFEDNNRDIVVARVCFSVVDQQLAIDAKIRGNTDTELNKSKQQLDFEVEIGNYQIQDPQSELKVVVRQNNRTDNERFDIKASYHSSGRLSFINKRDLIFEGGNEYNRFDFSSIYNYDERIHAIKFERPYYHIYLENGEVRSKSPYMQDYDANGGFIINYQNGYESVDLEADYMFVHFYLPVEQPFLHGEIYLGGWWNYNKMDSSSKMEYDPANGLYYKTLLLKQGGYNYQYWYLPKGNKEALTNNIEGSHWQTQNRYSIYVYHRPWGGRYDKLVGVKILE